MLLHEATLTLCVRKQYEGNEGAIQSQDGLEGGHMYIDM